MKVSDLKLFIENVMTNEVRNKIISESNQEIYHIKCEGEPIATFDSKLKAEEELPRYKKTHPDKELIIEKGMYENYSDMIDKLDEMGEELEEKENINMKNQESNENMDIDMSEDKQMCEQCGGEMKEGVCVGCGSKMMESTRKKRTLRLKESEMMKLISDILSESVPGLTVTKAAQSRTKKDSELHANEVAQKIKKATTFDGNDNPEFPKAIGKGEKMTRKPVEKEEEIVADNRGEGLDDLNYDYEPSEMYKKRQQMAIEGDTTMGNSHDAANVIKSNLPEKMKKKVQRKKEKKKQEPTVSWGIDWKEPINFKINESEIQSKSLLNEEIERMKKLALYNKKTQ
jgi:hypothetical protein